MASLVDHLTKETRHPWKRHGGRADAAVLFFGRPLPNGPHTISSHCVIVWEGAQEGEWHCDVLRREPPGRAPRALRVPGSMSWVEMIDFVVLLVDKLGGVSPLYQTIQT